MITSLEAFTKRYVLKRLNQRMEFLVRPSRFEHLEILNDDPVLFNGVLVGARRPKGHDLGKIRLKFDDVLINGAHYLKRRSRKEGKLKGFGGSVSVSLTDIVWPSWVSPRTKEGSTQPEQNDQGIAGFLARIVPAPGTPPDDQKTTRTVLRSGRGNTNFADDVMEAAIRDAQEMFNLLRKSLRNERQTGRKHLTDDQASVASLLKHRMASGESYRKVLEWLALRIIEAELDEIKKPK